MAGELLRVNSHEYAKAARQLERVSPRMLRAMKKELREEAKPLGQQMTAGLADASTYRGGLGSVMRSGRNWTKLVFRRDNATVSMNLRLVDRHPVFANRGVWVAQPIGQGTAVEAFEKGVDELQNKVANAAVKAAKEVL